MPTNILVATLILCSHALGMVAEYRVSRRNLAILAEHGGQTRSRGLMKALYLVWAAAIPAAVLGALLTGAVPDRAGVATGIAVIGLSQLLRRWAVESISPYWTMAIVALPGMRPLNAGPYRALKNPGYISRLTEICGVGLATGAFGPAGLALAVVAALAFKAQAAESAVLSGLNLAAEAPIE